MPGFTDEENNTIILSTYVTSILNLVGALFTITTFLIFKDARNVATSLIFCLALTDLCTASATSFIWNAAFTHPGEFLCNLQGALLMFGLCGSMMWGLMIGCYMFLVLYKNVDIEKIDKYRIVFHILSWGYALVAGILPVFFHKYAAMFPRNKKSWCWISDPNSIFRLLLYFPDTVIFMALVLLYGLIRFKLRRTQSTMANEICRKMSIYLLTYMFINFFAIVNRFQNFFFPKDAIFTLYLLQFITQPLQGFLNALAYVWNEPAFIDQYKQLFTKCKTQHVPTKQIQAEQERLMSLVCYDDHP